MRGAPKFLALGGAAGPSLFTGTFLLCSILRLEYSHMTQFISELGAQGASHAAVMNFAGFVPSGLLLAVFGISLRGVLPRRRLATAVAVLIGLFGTGMAAAGLFSCDPGCEVPASLEAVLHDAVSAIAFLSGLGAVALSTVLFRSVPGFRGLAPVSAVSSVAGLVFLIALFVAIGSGRYGGLWQRLFLGTLFAWCAVIGLRVFRSSRGESPGGS